MLQAGHQGLSQFFPKESCYEKKWTDQVKMYRDKWEPSEYSVLCSRLDVLLTESMGLGKKKTHLNIDPVPRV